MANSRIAIIAVCSLILVAIGVAVTVGVTRNDDDDYASATNKEVSANMKAVEAICAPVDFKETCVNSLKDANTTDPTELIKAGFDAAVKHITEAVKKSSLLQEVEKDPRAKGALEVCEDMMDSAISDLKRSFDKVASFDMSELDDLLDDLKVWLSAARTYEETCFDAFENTTSDAGKKMNAALKTATMITSNALAMVDQISYTLQSINIQGLSRRLLSQQPRSWTPDDFAMRKLLSASPLELNPNIVIAKDGSGNYTTINEALKDIPRKNKKRFVVYIKEGVYNEKVLFNGSNVMIIGDGPTKTMLTYGENFVDGTPTMKTASVTVKGDGFIAKDIGFENSAGAIKHQAVALRVQADQCVFHNCRMDGFQDTLYTHAKRQYYHNCTITGTIDFVFGNAPSVFKNCTFQIRQPLENQECIVTAQGRKERRMPTATVLQNCRIEAHSSYVGGAKVKSFLGRPWKEHSRTIIMNSYIDKVIDPQGWLPWSGTFGMSTCFYTEVNNTGPGADTSSRAKWRGVKKITPKHALDFTAKRFLKGDSWIPESGVPY